jgi:hypothetical protein
MAGLGEVGAVHAVAVALAGADARHVAVPVVGGAVGDGDALLGPVTVEQAQVDLGRVLGEDGEVRPLAVPGRAEGERASRPGFAAHGGPIYPGDDRAIRTAMNEA